MTASKLIALAGYMAVMVFPVTGEPAMAANSASQEMSAAVPSGDGVGLITGNDTLAEVMAHPNLAGFSEHLMPRPGRSFDPNMSLSEIGSLLPYHSNVRPDEVVAGLNRLASDNASGRQVFYPIYSDSEIAADPTKRDTGLFFFRAEQEAPFAIIAPGGGFAYVGSVHEGFPYATAINAEGYNAFVVRYRVGQGQQKATEDMAAAISYIARNTASLGVSMDGYSVWGSSAGARMAALIGSYGVARFGGDDLPGPSSVIMAYTSHANVSGSEPPTYVIVGESDGIAPPANMRRRVDALRAQGADVVFRIVLGVAHGFGTDSAHPPRDGSQRRSAFGEPPR